MAYGISILNESNYVQIDQDYSNYVIILSGTISISNTNTATLTYADLGITPMAMVKFHNTGTYITITRLDSTGMTLKTKTTGTWAVPYMLAVPISSVTADTDYGMRVYNSSNQLVFDSGKKYPRIHSSITKYIDTFGDPRGSIGHTCPVTEPWVVINALRGAIAQIRLFSTFAFAFGFKTNADKTLDFESVEISPQGNTAYAPAYTIQVALLYNP